MSRAKIIEWSTDHEIDVADWNVMDGGALSVTWPCIEHPKELACGCVKIMTVYGPGYWKALKINHDE